MRPFVFENPPLQQTEEGRVLTEYLSRQLLSIAQALASIDTGGEEGVITYGAQIPGTGNVWDDLNVADFTGEEYAGVDGCAATALSIKTNAIVTFGHNNIAYLWEGPTGVCVGLGGNYTTAADDLVPIGTGDHAILANRDQPDQHPQAAVTDLVTDQNTQNGRLASLESSQTIQDGRLDTLETHPPRLDNPHQVTHQQLPDANPDPADPHPIYSKKLPGMFMGGSVSNFTLNTTDSKLVNYPNYAEWNWPDDDDIDPTNGEITIPQDGLYTFTCQVIGTQGNNNKEEEIILKVNIAGGPDPGRFDIDYWEVATDKTYNRSLKSSFTRPAYAGEVISLWMAATTGLGTWTTAGSTFEIIQIAEIGELNP